MSFLIRIGRRVKSILVSAAAGVHLINAEKRAKQRNKEARNKITAMLSEGNVLLQHGNVCSQSDIDARWETISSYKFVK